MYQEFEQLRLKYSNCTVPELVNQVIGLIDIQKGTGEFSNISTDNLREVYDWIRIFLIKKTREEQNTNIDFECKLVRIIYDEVLVRWKQESIENKAEEQKTTSENEIKNDNQKLDTDNKNKKLSIIEMISKAKEERKKEFDENIEQSTTKKKENITISEKKIKVKKIPSKIKKQEEHNTKPKQKTIKKQPRRKFNLTKLLNGKNEIINTESSNVKKQTILELIQSKKRKKKTTSDQEIKHLNKKSEREQKHDSNSLNSETIKNIVEPAPKKEQDTKTNISIDKDNIKDELGDKAHGKNKPDNSQALLENIRGLPGSYSMPSKQARRKLFKKIKKKGNLYEHTFNN